MHTERQIAPSRAELLQLRQAILDSIAYRGQRKDESGAGCVIAALFENYARQPSRSLTWKEIWEACWKAEHKAYRDDSDVSLAPYAEKVRTTIYRARKTLGSYFRHRGRSQPVRAVIETGAYRLRFEQNDPSRTPIAANTLNRESTIGLLCALPDWFNAELIAGVERAAREEGRRVVVSFSSNFDPSDEAEQLKSLSQQCCGVIVVPSLDEFAGGATDLTTPFRTLLRTRYPLVFVDRPVPGCPAPLVGSDNENGGRLATEYLVKSCECSDVFVVAEPGSAGARLRIEGHAAYMREVHGPAYVSRVAIAPRLEEQGGLDAISSLVDRGDFKSALASKRKSIGIFATTDALARGIRAFLDTPERSKLSRRVHVIGFGGREFGRFMHPPLVSIRQDFYSVGRNAAEVLFQVLTEKNRGTATTKVSELSRKVPVDLNLPDGPWPNLLTVTGTAPSSGQPIGREPTDFEPGDLLE